MKIFATELFRNLTAGCCFQFLLVNAPTQLPTLTESEGHRVITKSVFSNTHVHPVVLFLYGIYSESVIFAVRLTYRCMKPVICFHDPRDRGSGIAGGFAGYINFFTQISLQCILLISNLRLSWKKRNLN